MSKTQNNTYGITPGHYILQNDVINPKPDRRTRNDFRCDTTWNKGLRIQVKEDWCEIGDGKRATWLTMTPYNSRYGRYESITENDEHRRFEALAAALNPAEDGVSLAREAADDYVEFSEFIDELLGNHDHTPALNATQIREIIATIRKRNDEQYEEEERARADAIQADAVKAALEVTSG